MTAGRRWHEGNLPIQLVIVEGENGSEVAKLHFQITSHRRGCFPRHQDRRRGFDPRRIPPAECRGARGYHRFASGFVTGRAREASIDPRPLVGRRPNTLTLPGHEPDPESLRFFNGYGGFNDQGDEYVIRLTPGSDGPPGLSARALGQRRGQRPFRFPGQRSGRRMRLVPQQPGEPPDPGGPTIRSVIPMATPSTSATRRRAT